MSDPFKSPRSIAEGEFRDMIPDETAMKELVHPADLVKKGHPPGLYLLFIVEMWERFSYYGMRGLLMLYLIRPMSGPGAQGNPGRGWEQGDASRLYGWYAGLAYLFPLLGGILADRFLGTSRSMVVGGTLIALGHIVLGLSGIGELAHSDLGMSLFIGGMALIVLGTGYFKPCVSVMVGQLYGPNDPRRDGAFTIFYMGINVGAFICMFVCGTLGELVGWHWGFSAAAVGMIAGLITYLVFRPRFLKGVGLPPENARNTGALFFLAALLLAAGFMGLAHAGFFRWLSDTFTRIFSNESLGLVLKLSAVALVIGPVIWFVSIQKPGEKGPTASIFIFMLFNAFFWIAFEQAGTTLNVFAERSTNRYLFGWEVPATWFQSVNALLIIALAPLFAIMWTALGRRNLDPSQPTKIGLGLVLLGVGYVFMVIAGKLNATGAQVGMFWLLATYAFHTFGELCLSPTGLSFVTKAAPVRFVSLLMGIWFISNFLANLGGGYIASYVVQIERGEIELFWYPWFKLGGRADFFFLFVVTSFGAGFTILLLTPLLKKLLPKEAPPVPPQVDGQASPALSLPSENVRVSPEHIQRKI
jgi:POT family proton-dependent oligopeptide transporter